MMSYLKLATSYSALAGWISLLLVIPATAEMKPSNAVVNSRNDSFGKIAQAQMREAMETDATTVTIEKLAPVFYIKDESLDSDRPNLQNLTMGIANKGEVVTIIIQQETMFKVRFEATDRIGWVSENVLSDL